MFLFKRKLDPDQIAEVERRADKLDTLVSSWPTSYDDLTAEIGELYALCNELNSLPMDPAGMQRIEASDVLIEKSRIALDVYIRRLTEITREFNALAPEDWYPKNFKKNFQSFSNGLKIHELYCTQARSALDDPTPLRVELGNHRVNVFVSGLSIVAEVFKTPHYSFKSST